MANSQRGQYGRVGYNQSHIQQARLELMIVLVKSVRLYTWNYSKILLVFNFTKQLEVDAAKQEQVVSHMACAPFFIPATNVEHSLCWAQCMELL